MPGGAAGHQPRLAVDQLVAFLAADVIVFGELIDRELGWAREKFGMNTMRVYLHDLLWQQDPKGMVRRIDQFLDIAIEPLFSSDPEETWTSTEEEDTLNDILDMVESEEVTYDFVTH